MTISVLMSTYKNEKPQYLDASLNSIWMEQIRKPEQVVIVEDGPLPNALYAVIDKWQKLIGDALVVIGINQNQGLALALNEGIKYCTGDLIARMDSDDLAVPDRLKIQEEYMCAHPDVDILGGALQEFNDEGTLNKVRLYPLSYKTIRSTIHKGTPLGHPTVMFRKRFFDVGYRYSNKYYICEDIKLWFEALKGGVIINNIPDVVLLFRRNDSTMCRRSRKKAWSEFYAYMNGIHLLDGIMTYKYIYPCLRLFFRLLPTNAIKWLYNSNLRKYIYKS